MTNLDTAPTEVLCTGADGTTAGTTQLLTPRDVPLGGPRAMTVRRTLPQRARSFIGAWCFADHYGPDDVAATGGMRVPPHPHTGLQTVSWLFSGEVEHRDSLGTHVVVRPGQLNLMTAGHGISHSEDSTDATTVLHGVQLWTVLPERDRDTAPRFDHHVPPVTPLPSGEARVFLGSLAGTTSPVPTFSPLVGAEVVLRAGTAWTVDVDPTFEHGVLVDRGGVTVEPHVARPDEARDGAATTPGPAAVPPSAAAHADRAELLHVAPGAHALTLRADVGEDLRVLLIGGEPLGEQIVMWWNFIGRDHAEVEAARRRWQAEIGADDARVDATGDPADGDPHAADLAADDAPDVRTHAPGSGSRFGVVVGHPHAPLPAPPMPNHRLKPRG
ncbi:pirin family protein [Actinotalea sp. AC32]|nr:pirin family protein [Actinotalea sp. AC32]